MTAKEIQRIPRKYGAYAGRYSVDLTPEQVQFMETVRARKGMSISQVIRHGLDLWRKAFEEVG